MTDKENSLALPCILPSKRQKDQKSNSAQTEAGSFHACYNLRRAKNPQEKENLKKSQNSKTTGTKGEKEKGGGKKHHRK